MAFENKGAMAATIVVAASDSLNKAAANYVCDGVADNVEIQAAIDALPAGGGKVVLLDGNYSFEELVTLVSKLELVISAGAYIEYAAGATPTTWLDLLGDTHTALFKGDTLTGLKIRLVGVISPRRDRFAYAAIGIFLDSCTHCVIDGGGQGVDMSVGVFLVDCDYCSVCDINGYVSHCAPLGTVVADEGGRYNYFGNLKAVNLEEAVDFNYYSEYCTAENIFGYGLTSEIIDVTESPHLIIKNTTGVNCAYGISIRGHTATGPRFTSRPAPADHSDYCILENINLKNTTNNGLTCRPNNQNGVQGSIKYLQVRGMNFNGGARAILGDPAFWTITDNAMDGLILDGIYLNNCTSVPIAIGNNFRSTGLYVSNVSAIGGAVDNAFEFYSWTNIKITNLHTDKVLKLNACTDIEIKNSSVLQASIELCDYGEIQVSAKGSTGSGIILSSSSHIKLIGCSSRDHLTASRWGISESGTSDYNQFKGNLVLNNTAGIKSEGVHSIFDQQIESSKLDLSAAAVDIEAFHATLPCVLVGYDIFYTEASSADAGVDVRIGRYQSGVALDDDYYDISTSEVSKALGYSKRFITTDLTRRRIEAGDTVTVGCAGGKAGTGEVIIVLHIAEMCDD